MDMVRRMALLILLAVLNSPLALAQDVEKLRGQFDSIIEGLNKDSFQRFLRAIDRKDMSDRIYSRRMVEPAVKSAFTAEFSTSIQQMFTSSFPSSQKEILGTIVDFQFNGDEGRAVVRYSASGYRFIYHVYELRGDSNDKLFIIDWLDYFQGSRFSEEAGAALVMALPSKAATRAMLDNKSADEGQVFQIGELFKAARDEQPKRFFQIYDGLDETMQGDTVVVRLNWAMALKVQDGARVEQAAMAVESAFPNDPLQSIRLVEYYIPSGQFEKAIEAINLLQQGLGIRDGATESLKASAAMALGNNEDAESFALQATQSEPTLELSWWSLLRARTAAKNYSGATEAMAHLEDDFGESLTPHQLRKDPYLRVLTDQQEYMDWRASRE